MSTATTTSHWLSQQHIIVSGLGISGTCFVVSLYQACQRHQIQFPKVSVYERDAELDTNFYSIGIRSDKMSGGLQVLQKLGLFEVAAKAHHIRDNKKFSIRTGDGVNIITRESTPLEENLRLSRYALRKMLLDALPEDVDIHWGSAIVKVEPDDASNIVKCHLTDGSVVECNVLVAADGSMSKARQSIHPDLWPQYNGMLFLFCRTQMQCEATEQQVDEAIEELKQHSKHLGPGFRHLIDNLDRKSVWRRNTYEMMPFKNTGNVICIGDANHAMSPTAGNGANMALMDGYELANQMVESDALKTALLVYDKQAMPRSASSIRMSRVSAFLMTSRVMYVVVKTVVKFKDTVSWLLGRNADKKHA